IKLIRRDVNSKMEMLELATGTGLIALRIADKVKYLEATDFSEEMIKEAKRKERPNNLNFSVEDACDLPYGSKTFDCVLISNALHIMPKPEEALSNIKRVLKDEGILIAPTFTHKSSIKAKVLWKLMSIVGFKAYSKWTTDEYIKFIKSNGFKIKKSKKIKGTFELAYIVAIKECR
ncbi:class I SAM-dependent methyltransferase, partial [Clostridium paraputrificum]